MDLYKEDVEKVKNICVIWNYVQTYYTNFVPLAVVSYELLFVTKL